MKENEAIQWRLKDLPLEDGMIHGCLAKPSSSPCTWRSEDTIPELTQSSRPGWTAPFFFLTIMVLVGRQGRRGDKTCFHFQELPWRVVVREQVEALKSTHTKNSAAIICQLKMNFKKIHKKTSLVKVRLPLWNQKQHLRLNSDLVILS